jgi:hypothetical protein
MHTILLLLALAGPFVIVGVLITLLIVVIGNRTSRP